jgi:hypothetical protein
MNLGIVKKEWYFFYNEKQFNNYKLYDVLEYATLIDPSHNCYERYNSDFNDGDIVICIKSRITDYNKNIFERVTWMEKLTPHHLTELHNYFPINILLDWTKTNIFDSLILKEIENVSERYNKSVKFKNIDDYLDIIEKTYQNWDFDIYSNLNRQSDFGYNVQVFLSYEPSKNNYGDIRTYDIPKRIGNKYWKHENTYKLEDSFYKNFIFNNGYVLVSKLGEYVFGSPDYDYCDPLLKTYLSDNNINWDDKDTTIFHDDEFRGLIKKYSELKRNKYDIREEHREFLCKMLNDTTPKLFPKKYNYIELKSFNFIFFLEIEYT